MNAFGICLFGGEEADRRSGSENNRTTRSADGRNGSEGGQDGGDPNAAFADVHHIGEVAASTQLFLVCEKVIPAFNGV